MENNFRNNFEKRKSFFEKLKEKKKTVLYITLFSAISHIGLIWAHDEDGKGVKKYEFDNKAEAQAEKTNKEDSEGSTFKILEWLDEEKKRLERKLEKYKFKYKNITNNEANGTDKAEAEEADKEVKEILDTVRNNTDNKVDNKDEAQAQAEAEEADKEVKEILDTIRNNTDNETDKANEAQNILP